MIAIVGAGLTGLSAAFHLKNRSYRIFEQEDTPGGLCRSTEADGFTFDYTGHLLYIKNSYTHRMLKNILPGKFIKIIRKSAVYYKGKYLPYPFQANTYGLPKEVVFECVMGFIDTYMNRSARQGSSNFRDWVIKTFGKGISEHFFIPYNEKLWQMDLRRLTSEWASWSVPRPTLQEVIQGALGIQNIGMGYNPSFFYPRKGGIEILPRALSKNIKNINFGKKLASVNLSKRCIIFHDGEEVSYDALVSTIALPQLLSRVEDLPPLYKRASSKLCFVSVQNLNIGVNRERVSDYHWVYFPEPDFPFYRVGFYSNLSPGMAPKKTSSMYIEISSTTQNKKDYETIMEVSVDGLKRCGILKKGDRIVASNYAEIEYAYVVFDKFRKKTLPDIINYLKKHGVLSIGRYGAWTYSSMEDGLLQGREIAEKLKQKS
jgi:protoporphyrinogen oxidase